jgi:hypothetical protein
MTDEIKTTVLDYDGIVDLYQPDIKQVDIFTVAPLIDGGITHSVKRDKLMNHKSTLIKPAVTAMDRTAYSVNTEKVVINYPKESDRPCYRVYEDYLKICKNLFNISVTAKPRKRD